MGSKTVVMMPEAQDAPRPKVALGIQSDAAFTEAAKALRGRDLTSIADLSVQELAALMELSHAVSIGLRGNEVPTKSPARCSTTLVWPPQ